MSANTILTSTITGGDNNHTTTSEEANSLATDFVTQGVVGAITLNTGSGGTGSFCVNADASPDMGVTIKAGQAYITATPSSQNSQVLRARAAADYTAYTISANASGSTKYDWIYLSVDATKANNPASDASDVTSIVTSRSSSNSTDNGSPPTYGLLLAIVTVANAASSITNSNITDKRFNTSIGAQNGSLIVTQQATGDNAIVQAAGQDANINLQLSAKGTGWVDPGRLIASGIGTQITATGNYTITGLGFKPRVIQIFACLEHSDASNHNASTSTGVYDRIANTQGCLITHAGNGTYGGTSSSTKVISIQAPLATKQAEGTISATSTDGFTLNIATYGTVPSNWTYIAQA